MLMQMLVLCLAAAGATAIALLVLVLRMPRRQCPDCSALLPRLRKPSSAREAMLGGTTCPQCGCHVDREGRKIAT
jgi:hypothetical protein